MTVNRSAGSRQVGNAVAEVLVAMLVFTPLMIGIPLLGKQLDVKHKTYDATRYSVWERTVWRDVGAGNRKSAADISLEARDRTLGHPKAGLLTVAEVRTQGVTENPLWVDQQQRRLLNYSDQSMPMTATLTTTRDPIRVGMVLVPTMSYEGGIINASSRLTGLESLGMNDRSFAQTSLRLEMRAKLSEMASRPVSLRREAAANVVPPPIAHEASGALLSDTWSARDEAGLRNRVDRLTVNEALAIIELPARPIGALALGKGEILYGEGQYAWDPQFDPNSTTLPRAYVQRR